MERKQMLVRLLDGKTLCLQIPCATVSGEALKEFLFARTGIPLRLQRLVSGLREIGDETLISASEDGAFPSCSLLLRLRGGKGGFGVLLRSAAARDGHQKTTNYDACRDLSGRRLRHANAEKRLEDWKTDADGRKLEKLADQFLAGKTQRVGKASSEAVAKYMDKYEESARRMEEVEESVRRSFQLYQTLKRKALPSSGSPWKRRRSESESESDSEDEDDEDLHKSSANTAC